MKTFGKLVLQVFKLNHLNSLILLSLFLLVATGCSTFNRDWEKAAAKPNPMDIQGRWQGSWLSSANSHSGELRCLVEKVSEQKYRARFDSTYKKVLHFKSTVMLKGTNDANGFRFNGKAKLPWWAGGIYHYEGNVSPTNFFSTYKCKYDHGTFQMTRPSERQKAF